MIPKAIHYCWFGRNPKPKLAEKCIRSWKKHCPDYEIIEWNEDNYDLSMAPLYVRQAYEAKKWAFVTDYVRLQVVYEHGGIYMDTDVELIKPLDDLLTYDAYFGFEDERFIATGLGFGARKHAPILKELMDDYQDTPFLLQDGSYDVMPCPQRNTEIFRRHHLMQDGRRQILDGDILILPPIVLCPIDFETKLRRYSADTISIHWYDASWQTEEERNYCAEEVKKQRKKKMVLFVKDRAKQFLGEKTYLGIKKMMKRGHTEDADN